MTSVADRPILNLDELSEGDRVHVVRQSKTAAWNCGVWRVRRVYRHIRAMVVEKDSARVFVKESDPTFLAWAHAMVEKSLW